MVAQFVEHVAHAWPDPGEAPHTGGRCGRLGRIGPSRQGWIGLKHSGGQQAQDECDAPGETRATRDENRIRAVMGLERRYSYTRSLQGAGPRRASPEAVPRVLACSRCPGVAEPLCQKLGNGPDGALTLRQYAQQAESGPAAGNKQVASAHCQHPAGCQTEEGNQPNPIRTQKCNGFSKRVASARSAAIVAHIVDENRCNLHRATRRSWALASLGSGAHVQTRLQSTTEGLSSKARKRPIGIVARLLDPPWRGLLIAFASCGFGSGQQGDPRIARPDKLPRGSALVGRQQKHDGWVVKRGGQEGSSRAAPS